MERQHVPTAFQSELTEYTSLLRALRSRNTLDLSLHLARHGGADSSGSDSGSDDSDDLNDRAPAGVVAGTKRKRKNSNRLSRKRDSWTRWPLLLNDLHKPTWTFDDEVIVAASQAQKLIPPPFSSWTELPSPYSPNKCSGETSVGNGGDEQEDDANDLDDPSHYKFIGMSASTFLSKILVLLSLHVPLRPPSMQNRIEPLDWRSVLEIVSVYGDASMVDEQLINTVKTRMEALYNIPSTSSLPETEGDNLIAYRLRKNIEAKLRLESMMAQAHDSLFTLTEPPPDFFTKPRASNTIQRERADKKVKPTSKGAKKIKLKFADEFDERPLAMTTKEQSVVYVKSRPIKKAKAKNKDPQKLKSAEFIPSSDSSDERTHATIMKDINYRTNGSATTGTIHNVIQETEHDDIDGNSEEAASQASIPPAQDIPRSESQSEDEPPRRMRHMPSRRAKSNMSYTAPDYFFDKNVMG